MDIDLNTLLVALMFVTILSLGIGNILVTLSDVINHASRTHRDRVHVAWIVLMLLVHFNLFWHTKEILEVKDWQFDGFLFTMAGPSLLFFATSILLTEPPDGEPGDQTHFFISLGRRFFVIFALLQLWIVLADVLMVGSFRSMAWTNVALASLTLWLWFARSHRAQVIGAFLAWGVVALTAILRALLQGT